jgi:hypothetical protein
MYKLRSILRTAHKSIVPSLSSYYLLFNLLLDLEFFWFKDSKLQTTYAMLPLLLPSGPVL